MAKMKFYLNIEGEKLRTLDDLRENFFADDVLSNYQSGKLARWLDVWGYNDELQKVQAIQSTNAREILAELGRIFNVEVDAEIFDSDMSVESHLKEKEEALKRELEKQKAEALREELQEKVKFIYSGGYNNPDNRFKI